MTYAVQSLLDDLTPRMPGRIATGAALRASHASTLTWITPQLPDAVVWAETAADVQAVLVAANRYGVPVIPFAGGTSLEGQLNAPAGGISLDLTRMNRIIRVSPDDQDAEVEAGVTRPALNAYLRDTGLFFSVDPGAETATLGGMAATRASGTNAVRYGTIRDNVLSLKAVLADGTMIETGKRARKSAAGYDLTRLLIGSEGTLGVITSLCVRLHPIPQTVIAAALPFPTVAAAAAATIEALQMGLGMARIELLDSLQIRAVNAHAKLALPESPTLFVECHGLTGAAHEAMRLFGEIATANGALSVTWGEDEDTRRRLWQARHDAFWAVKTMWPGRTAIVTDVAVPISALARCITQTEQDIHRTGLIAPIVGHVGDGNFHVIPMIDIDNPDEMRRVEGFVGRLVTRALMLEGTCTGEHGIGQGKLTALAEEMGSALCAMRLIKQALDPKGILNPGKIGQ